MQLSEWQRCMPCCTPTARTNAPKLPLATTLEGSGHSLNQEKAQAAKIKCHKAAYGSICPEVEASTVSACHKANKCRRGEHIAVLCTGGRHLNFGLHGCLRCLVKVACFGA